MDFAEKAWRFPKSADVQSDDTIAIRSDERFKNRRLPWTSDKENDEEDCEHTFFDRIGGDVLCWANLMNSPETIAATKKLTEHLTSHPGHEEFDEDCEDIYYDETGDALCWVI